MALVRVPKIEGIEVVARMTGAPVQTKHILDVEGIRFSIDDLP